MNIYLNKSVTITGQGKDTSIDGQGKTNIFEIKNGVTVKISNIQFTRGKSDNGGAIYNSGTLNLDNCVFYNNQANIGGAVYNENTLNLVNTEMVNNIVEGEGGAIENRASDNSDTEAATLTISYSNLKGNKAAQSGGAIGNWGTAIVTNNNFPGK